MNNPAQTRSRDSIDPPQAGPGEIRVASTPVSSCLTICQENLERLRALQREMEERRNL